MGTFNARHIYPIGYSRRRCGATVALIRQPQTHPHNEEPEIRNRILWEGVRFVACRRKPECPEKTYQGGHGIGKPNSRTTTGKPSQRLSTKTTHSHPLRLILLGMLRSNQRRRRRRRSCIGERPSVRAPNQPALPQGQCES